jgi:hydroxypyruvate isomerase
MPGFSANIGFMWPDRPMLARIAAAGHAGFRAIEMHWPYDIPAADLAAACKAADVTVLSLNTPRGDLSRGEVGLGALPGRERDFAKAFGLSLDYARTLGAPFVHAMAGLAPPDSAAAERTLIANLASAADIAAEAGVGLLLEALNTRDNPGYFYSTVERAAEIADKVGRPNVKLMFDIYHVGVGQGDILTRLEKLLPLVGHIQIAAVPSRAEPDEGEIAYDRILRHIDASDYAGWIGCEYKPRGDTEAGLGWIEALGFSLDSERQ